jgi:hypothetical protein
MRLSLELILVIGSSARLRQFPQSALSLDGVDQRLANFYSKQIEIDRLSDEATPRLTESFEFIPGLGKVTIGKLLGLGSSSVVYAVQEYPHVALKYEANCHNPKDIPNLIKDMYFGALAFDAGISHERFYVSPPALITFAQPYPKTTFRGGEQFLRSCISAQGTVRYMLMERVDGCLGLIGNGKIGSVRLATKVGATLISSLEKLHTKVGIGHGDVHPGNICVVGASFKEAKIVLIDFERSFFMDRVKTTRGSPVTHPGSSPWELQGFPTSARDDVFNAVFSVADVMYKGSPWAYASELARSKNHVKLVEWKTKGDVFGYPVDQIAKDHSIKGKKQAEAIRAFLAQALWRVRRLEASSSPVDYKGISDDFKGAYSWVQSSHA